MNKRFSILINKDNGRLLVLFLILCVSLIASALIFYMIRQDELIKISYNRLKNFSLLRLFLEILKRNAVYFIIVILLACLGLHKCIYVIFSLTSIMYGASIIYYTKIVAVDKLYFIFNITDYLLYFPILFYFTYMSSTVSKYIKKEKKIKTNTHKIDIIVLGYLKLSFIFVALVIAYSFLYSSCVYWIL